MLSLLTVRGLTDHGLDESDAKARPSPFEDSYQRTGRDGALWVFLSPLSRYRCRIPLDGDSVRARGDGS